MDAIDAQRCALTVSPNAASRAHGSRLRFARARTYLDAHRWAEAAAAFRELARDPQAPDAAAAAPLYLEAFYAAPFDKEKGRKVIEDLGKLILDPA